MKRILHIIAQYPGKTGSGIFLQSLINEGGKLKYSQAVIAAISKKMEEVKFKKEHNIKFYPVEFNTEKIGFNIVGMSDVMPYESTKYSELTDDMYNIWKENFENEVKKAINEFKPEIIIAHHLYLLTSIVNKLRGDIKLIVLSQGTELRQLELNPKYKDLVIKGCKSVDMVCALNNYQAKKIIGVYGISENNIKVMGVGYSSEVFNYNCKLKKKKQVIFAGKLSSSKGLRCLISSFKSLNENIELLIAGSGEEESSMKLLAKDDNRIKFLGNLSQVELSNVLRESEVFILPSFYEGLPLVIMEALACRAKVIMSDIKGVSEWVGENINSSGAINYLKLPRLRNIDTPFEEDIEEFEESIRENIINMLDKRVDFEGIETDVLKRSWGEYFKKLEKYF